jgi:hypothetical protein
VARHPAYSSRPGAISTASPAVNDEGAVDRLVDIPFEYEKRTTSPPP